MYRLCAEFILILVQKISYPPPVLPEPLAEEEFVNIFQKLTNKCVGLYCFCNSTPYYMYVKVDLKVDTPGLKVSAKHSGEIQDIALFFHELL